MMHGKAKKQQEKNCEEASSMKVIDSECTSNRAQVPKC